ncbi:hypothetical protein PVAP13_6NG003431, partial [Panicum virgatum]
GGGRGQEVKGRKGWTHIAAAHKRFQAAAPKKRRGSPADSISTRAPTTPAARPFPTLGLRVPGPWGGFRPARLPPLGCGGLLASP